MNSSYTLPLVQYPAAAQLTHIELWSTHAPRCDLECRARSSAPAVLLASVGRAQCCPFEPETKSGARDLGTRSTAAVEFKTSSGAFRVRPHRAWTVI